MLSSSTPWRQLLRAFIVALFLYCETATAVIKANAVHTIPKEDFLALQPKDIDGALVPFKSLEGKILLITNVASECGATHENYEQLTEMDKMYRPRGLEILAFPCNQFGNQEPGGAAEIKTFCGKYDAKFKIMEKVHVNGPNEHPVFKVLKHGGEDIKWNFYSKFVVSCYEKSCTIQRFDNVLPKLLIPAFENRLQGDANEKPSGFLSLLVSIGFLVAFVFMMQYCLNGARGKNQPRKKRR